MSRADERTRLLTIAEVCAETTLCRQTIWRKARAGTFPKAKQIAANRVAWLSAEIDRWKADPSAWSPNAN